MNTDNTKPAGRGDTVPQQGTNEERQRGVPRAPNDHDESADSQSQDEPSQQRMGELGRKAVESGQVDTDKGPVLRELHEKKI